MSFWSDPQLDPKRQYRFQVYVGNFEPFIAKNVKKPSYTVGVSRHMYLNHEFKYPTTVKWQDVTMTFADPADSDTTKSFMAILQNAGYTFPTSPGVKNTISRDKSVEALGQVKIEQIDADGEVIERFTLHNVFISQVEFGQLSYASEDMVEITATFVYDWAEIDYGIGGTGFVEPE